MYLIPYRLILISANAITSNVTSLSNVTNVIKKGAPGVMVIVVGNGSGDTCSNPGRD